MRKRLIFWRGNSTNSPPYSSHRNVYYTLIYKIRYSVTADYLRNNLSVNYFVVTNLRWIFMLGVSHTSPSSLCWSQRVKVRTCRVGKGHSFKLLLGSVCQSWGWEEPSGAAVGQRDACAAPTWLLKAVSRVHGAREGLLVRVTLVSRVLEESWPLTEQNVGKAPFAWNCFYSFSTDPGLSGVGLQPFLCIVLFHICYAEIMMWSRSALITNAVFLVLL